MGGEESPDGGGRVPGKRSVLRVPRAEPIRKDHNVAIADEQTVSVATGRYDFGRTRRGAFGSLLTFGELQSEFRHQARLSPSKSLPFLGLMVVHRRAPVTAPASSKRRTTPLIPKEAASKDLPKAYAKALSVKAGHLLCTK